MLGQPLLFVYKEIDSPCLGPELKRVLLLRGVLMWAVLTLAQVLAQVLVAVRVEARSCSYGLGMVLQQTRRYELVLVDNRNSAWYILLPVTV